MRPNINLPSHRNAVTRPQSFTAVPSANSRDSAIVCVNQLQKFGNSEPTGYKIKAQSFWGLEEKDSAICYASQALACPCSLNDSINMLYILSHNPQNKDIDSVLSITSERADKQFLYTNRQESLAHAIEILKQDLFLIMK